MKKPDGQCIFIEDDHDKCIWILLRELKALKTLESSTVIHIGAHKGEEVLKYREYGFKSIFLVEANPDLSEELEISFENDPDVQVLNYTISDMSKEIDFYIHTTQNGSMAS